ncbi:UNVERIFIED_CONTAM: hypothetical protein Sindi_0666400 [Sesamum indicum]
MDKGDGGRIRPISYLQQKARYLLPKPPQHASPSIPPYSTVDQLRDRFYTFQWVRNHPGVTWNHDERRLTADDAMWQAICRENRLARCFQNAYEPKWEELCVLFDEDENLGIPVPDEEEEEDDADLFPYIPDMAAPPT